MSQGNKQANTDRGHSTKQLLIHFLNKTGLGFGAGEVFVIERLKKNNNQLHCGGSLWVLIQTS